MSTFVCAHTYTGMCERAIQKALSRSHGTRVQETGSEDNPCQEAS